MSTVVTHADGAEFFTIPNKTLDETHTSLTLPGPGAMGWGNAYVENFVKLLENFASEVQPNAPQIGQLWYDKQAKFLKVYTIDRKWDIVNKDSSLEVEIADKFEQLKSHFASQGILPKNPSVGQLWYDASNGMFQVYTGTAWHSAMKTPSSFIQPQSAGDGELWFDKNIKSLKVHDGSQFQRIPSVLEGEVAPVGAIGGQFWRNTTTGDLYTYKIGTSGGGAWDKIGGSKVTEGSSLPVSADVGAFFMFKATANDTATLYVNKGTFSIPVWKEVPEFGGAFVSSSAPVKVVDGMMWLNSLTQELQIRKGGKWFAIDESAITYVSNMEPTVAKDGMVWFDTTTGALKVMVNGMWSVTNSNVKSSEIAPTSNYENQMWFDTSVGYLKIKRGSNWDIVQAPGSALVSISSPTNESTGQFWFDSIDKELKIRKTGRWATIPENARAMQSYPVTPKAGDMVYVNNRLQVHDGVVWQDINVTINQSGATSQQFFYDKETHEVVIDNSGVIQRISLGVSKEVVVENVGITDEMIEIIRPNIPANQRRIIEVQNVDLRRPFLVFKNGVFVPAEDLKVDNHDLLISKSHAGDKLQIIQFEGDLSISYNVISYISNVNGNFTIDETTVTEAYNVAVTRKAELLASLLAAHGAGATIADLTPTEVAQYNAIELPAKTFNVADLSIGAVLVFKEGVLVPNETIAVNTNNQNKIVLGGAAVGERFTICQLIAGKDYKSAFFSKQYSTTIGAIPVNLKPDSTDGKPEDSNGVSTTTPTKIFQLLAGVKSPIGNYTASSKTFVMDAMDLDLNSFFFVFKNNILIGQEFVTINKVANTVSVTSTNPGDTIRIEQFYLPTKYVPIEKLYIDTLCTSNGWVTMTLGSEFNLDKRLMVYRNGLLLGTDSYTLDKTTRTVKIFDILKHDLCVIMQTSQPETFDETIVEMYATVNGDNIFTVDGIDLLRPFVVYRNGIMCGEEFHSVTADRRLLVKDCMLATQEMLDINPDAKGDNILVYQMNSLSDTQDDIVFESEDVISTINGNFSYSLTSISYTRSEFILATKNGLLVSRRQPESEKTTVSQVNTYQFDEAMNFLIDNCLKDEVVKLKQEYKKIVDENVLSANIYKEELPVYNQQRIYTQKFDQLSHMTMMFQDGYLIDREMSSVGADCYRDGQAYRVVSQYAVDNLSKSVIIKDWKVGGKLRVQQYTAKGTSAIQTVTTSMVVQTDNTTRITIPNNESYVPNAGALELYVDRQIMWPGEDYIETDQNTITFVTPLRRAQVLRFKITKF